MIASTFPAHKQEEQKQSILAAAREAVASLAAGKLKPAHTALRNLVSGYFEFEEKLLQHCTPAEIEKQLGETTGNIAEVLGKMHIPSQSPKHKEMQAVCDYFERKHRFTPSGDFSSALDEDEGKAIRAAEKEAKELHQLKIQLQAMATWHTEMPTRT